MGLKVTLGRMISASYFACGGCWHSTACSSRRPTNWPVVLAKGTVTLGTRRDELTTHRAPTISRRRAFLDERPDEIAAAHDLEKNVALAAKALTEMLPRKR